MTAHPQFALGQSVGFAAFTWGYPLVETLRTCRLQTVEAGASWQAAIDRLHSVHRVSTHEDRDVVTPANDLLYTTAWIHLGDGPRLLRVPARAKDPRRYFVLALYDAWTNNFANPGFRESPAEGEWIALVGPRGVGQASLPEGVRVIHSPTSLVWMIARVLAGEGDDVQAARALQADIELACPPGTDHGRAPSGVAGWLGAPEDTIAACLSRPEDTERIAQAFYTNLCRGLADQAAPVADAGLAAWFARAGLVASADFSFDTLSEPLRRGLTQGLRDAVTWVEQFSRSRRAKPWAMNTGIGRYGTEYLVRAITAYKGLGALAIEEAIYAMADFDADRQPLDGRHRYLLRFEAGDLPPVDGFWSVTMYDADRFLFANPLGRHSIGDRTPGLVTDPDGALVLTVSHDPPPDTRNWLPAPAGPCYLVLRMYVPRPETRAWTIPPLRRAQAVRS